MEERNNKIIELKSAMSDSEFSYHSKFANYKPDEELLQSTTRIKNQRDVILDRINKMEDSRDRVNPSVYEKVKRDYSLQLQTISELLDEKKANLKKEVKDLYLRREKLTVEINRHKEILEEAEFRHFLGEFSQNQFQEVQNYESKEVDKLEGDLSRISQFIRSHETLFDPEDLGQTTKSQPKPSEDVTKTAFRQPITPAQEQRFQPTATGETRQQQPARAPREEYTQETARQEPQHAPAAEKKSPLASPSNVVSQKINVDEFEDLFNDDDDAHTDTKLKLQQSQSNINQIIETETSGISGVMPLPEDDYFSEAQVNEASLTAKKSAINLDEHSEITPHNVSLTDIKTDINLTPPPAAAPLAKKAPAADDSISDILNSIQLDDEMDAPAAPTIQKPAQQIATNSSANGYVLKLIEGDLDQSDFPLKENMSIGRSSSNDIVLKAPKVSRQHAAINMYNDQFIIIDLKSSNGVYVNGSKIDECILKLGDEVSVGGYRFVFEAV